MRGVDPQTSFQESTCEVLRWVPSTAILNLMKTGDKVMLHSLNYTTDLSAPVKVWLEGTVVAVRRGRVVVDTVQGRCQVKIGSASLKAAA